jgi:hypothetical protein
MREQLERYIKDGYPDNTLYECGFFIYKNNDLHCKLLDDWWEENIKYSYQDQLSLPYLLWKHNIKPTILNDDNFVKNKITGSVWNNKLVGIVKFHKHFKSNFNV